MMIEESRRQHEQAMEMGRQARRAGKKRDTNPYRLGSSTDRHDSWHQGWDSEHLSRKGAR